MISNLSRWRIELQLSPLPTTDTHGPSGLRKSPRFKSGTSLARLTCRYNWRRGREFRRAIYILQQLRRASPRGSRACSCWCRAVSPCIWTWDEFASQTGKDERAIKTDMRQASLQDRKKANIRIHIVPNLLHNLFEAWDGSISNEFIDNAYSINLA